MKTKKEPSRPKLSVDIDIKLRKRLKAVSAIEGVTMSEKLHEILDHALSAEPVSAR